MTGMAGKVGSDVVRLEGVKAPMAGAGNSHHRLTDRPCLGRRRLMANHSPSTSHIHTPTTVEIPLSQGKVALIDAADYERVSQHKWCVIRLRGRKRERYYAITSEPGNNATKIYLHRFIMEPPAGMVVDHINGDTLDNRQSNLRVCTYSQNSCNQVNRRRSQSGYRGVYPHKRRFRATITVGGNLIRLGSFATASEAAVAYDEAAILHHGEFATLNFPDRQEGEAA